MMGHVVRYDKELHYTVIEGVIEGQTTAKEDGEIRTYLK